MCDSIGGYMKKLVARVVLALFVANVASTSMTVEASWLSKQLDNLFGTGETVQTEADRQRAEEMRDLPKHTDADYQYKKEYRPYNYGVDLPKSDFVVVGVPLYSNFGDIKRSLGEPTSQTYEDSWLGRRYKMRYGGITFIAHYTRTDANINSAKLFDTLLTNRDATTARGIAVGDKLTKVYSKYGRPDFVSESNEWFYGIEDRGGPDDATRGIWFRSDGYKVESILIGNHLWE